MHSVCEILRDLWQNPLQPRFTVPLLIVNFLGSVYGYFWYEAQLASTPVYFWPFVPDSPLSTTLFALALLMAVTGTGSALFHAFAVTASIKYGVWAVVIITHYWAVGGPVAPAETMLWFSHLGMALQGVIFFKTIDFIPVVILLTGAWMLINDLMDYVFGHHPYLFADGQEYLALVTALLLSIVITLGLARQRGKKYRLILDNQGE